MVDAARSPRPLSRREFVIGGALGASAILAAAAGRGAAATAGDGLSPALENLVPDDVAEWTASPLADVLIPRAEKAEEKTYDDVVTRYYDSRASLPVMLLIAYGKAQNGDTDLHRPESCYPVAGFKLRRQPGVTLRLPRVTIAARTMTALASDRTEQLLYWTRVGEDFPTSSASQRWSAMRQALSGSTPDGVLVRMSALSGDRDDAVEILQRFARELLAAGGPALRRVLTGRP